MEWLLGAASLFLSVVGGAIAFLAIAIGLPVWLHHRRKMAELRGTHAQILAQMEERLQSLEKKCDKLEEQVLECQTQMADEGRELDQRLAQVLSQNANK